jgi:hypothetical protein
MKSCVLLALSLAVSSPCMGQFHLTIVDYPGAAITRLIGINDHGDMVGHYILPGQPRHALKYSGGTIEALDPVGLLGTHESAANQINNRGDITGWYTDDQKVRHGYVLRDGTVHTVDYPGATLTQVNGVSDTGVVFGHFRDPVTKLIRGFMLKDGLFTQVDVPGALNTWPYYINTRGDVAGESNDVSSTTGHGFVLTKDGTWVVFDVPGASPNSTLAIGINDRRQILGYCQINGQQRTFLVRLNDVGSIEGYTFIDVGLAGVTPETMNNAGMFVGFYTDGAGTHGLIADPTGGWR